MAARENDPEYHGPPTEVDTTLRAPNHRGGATEREAAEPSTTSDANANAKPIEKTISCVSCRKRKLKCDRVKPLCGTCNRLRHDCEYPERRRNLGSKRRNMNELEARLAQVETQLVSEQSKAATTQVVATSVSMEADWNGLSMDVNMDKVDDVLLAGTFDMDSAGFGLPTQGPMLLMGDLFSQELLELGLSEPLPPQEMMDDLHQIYFEKFHPQVPFMHKYRYYTSLSKSPKFRPPICLRYAMWAVAASLSDKYRCYDDLLYERARRYIQDAEMKGHGEAFVSIYHAQTWGLISNFEAKKTYFSRSWMSTGRMVRLTQMLGLNRLDMDKGEFKQILLPARDWIELEERRRTFWAAYYGDRWASSDLLGCLRIGTGWPMLVHEDEIFTNLPSSEEAFEQGMVEPTISLAEALTPDGARNLSPFAGVILSATLFGHNFVHLHKSGPDEHPEDPINGEFWKRHRKMDNVLSNTFMFLPDHLRLPSNIRNMNVVFLHMNIHASCISLHQAAILTAEKHSLERNVANSSRSRCLLAAEEISNIMRLVCHVDKSLLHPWIGFCLYMASGVFIKDQKLGGRNPAVMANLEFLISAMRSIGTKHAITNHFTAQVELDMQAAGLGKIPLIPSVEVFDQEMPSLPISGILPDRHGLPMTYANLQTFVTGNPASNPVTGVLPRGGSTSSPHSGEGPDIPSEPSSVWESGRRSTVEINRDSPQFGSTSNSASTLFDQTGLGFAGSAGINRIQQRQRDQSTTLETNRDSLQLGSTSNSNGTLFEQAGLGGLGFTTRTGIHGIQQQQGDQPSPGNTMQFTIRESTPANTKSPPGFPWPSSGVVLGHDLEVSSKDVADLRLLDGTNGWTLPADTNTNESDKPPTGITQEGDKLTGWCPYLGQQESVLFQSDP